MTGSRWMSCKSGDGVLLSSEQRPVLRLLDRVGDPELSRVNRLVREDAEDEGRDDDVAVSVVVVVAVPDFGEMPEMVSEGAREAEDIVRGLLTGVLPVE